MAKGSLEKFEKKLRETQEKLERRYAEIEVIEGLTRKLGVTSELSTVMGHIAEAIRELFPDVTVAYAIAPLESTTLTDLIYVHTGAKLGEKYLSALEESIRDYLRTLPGLEKRRKVIYPVTTGIQRLLRSDFYFVIVEGERDPKAEILPASQVNVPIIISKAITGLINLSSPKAGVFGEKELAVLYTIRGIGAQTIERLKTLAASEHSRLVDLVESMTDGVLMFDTKQRVVVANSAIKRIAELEGEEFTLADFLNLLRESRRVGAKEKKIDLQATIDKVITTGKTIRFEEVPFRSKSFEIFVTAVRDYRQKVSGGAVILHDITHLKEIDRMKTEFVSMASHQLRTPLTAIKLFIEMLVDEDVGKLNQKQKDYMADVADSTERMIKLVNQLLSVSRLETGRLRIEPRLIQLEDFVQHIIDEAKLLARDKECRIRFKKLAKRLPKIPIDPSLMREVIQNILTNSVEYSPEGGRVDVGLQRAKNEIKISISNNGPGIPKQEQPHIFEKFYRGGSVERIKPAGTGLGLYISKMIMEASGGKIWFKSEGRKGATFYVSLPVEGMKKTGGEKVPAEEEYPSRYGKR